MLVSFSLMGSVNVLSQDVVETTDKVSEAPKPKGIDDYNNECLLGDFSSCQISGNYYHKKKDKKQSVLFWDRACRGNLKRSCLKYECHNPKPIFASCYQLGMIAEEKQLPQAAKMYYKRACDGEIDEGCYKLKEESDSILLHYMSIILIGIAVLIVARTMFQDESQFRASEKLEDNVSKSSIAENGIILKYSRPVFKRYISPIVGSMKAKKKIREKYKRVIACSGLSDILTPDDFFSFKIFLIIGFPVVFLGIRAFLEETWPLSYIPLISVGGFFYPDIWIKGAIQKRQRAVLMAMPFAVDMLALSVEAGLDFIAAMQKVMEKAKRSALVDEFEIMLKEIKVGASRAEALRNLAWRIDLIELSSFCATLIAADSVGASIGPILKNLAGDIRQKKSADIEQQAAKAATKILIPMIFFIVPAVLLMIAAPLVGDFVGN
ncbi:MAG: type II secretion system F family protein [Bacteriovoracaceae bacterium]|nr:type II secretion system F family protein [Bacteriovoracaceae bacterium]